VLTRDEVRAVLLQLEGTPWLMASLLYGSGLRLMECLRLRVKDVDFGQNHILVRDGKGQKDRVTLLSASLRAPLKAQIEAALALHQRDLACSRDQKTGGSDGASPSQRRPPHPKNRAPRGICQN
jgi:integrase